MATFAVSWTITIDDVDTPLEAARLAAATLEEPGAPARGYYDVTDMDTQVQVGIDLDLPENGGRGEF
jgi:hypothetical protein